MTPSLLLAAFIGAVLIALALLVTFALLKDSPYMKKIGDSDQERKPDAVGTDENSDVPSEIEQTVSSEPPVSDVGEQSSETVTAVVSSETANKDFSVFSPLKSPLIVTAICLTCVVWIAATLITRIPSVYIAVDDALLLYFMTVLAVIDYRSHLVPNKMLLAMLLAFVVLDAVTILISPKDGLEFFFRGLAGSIVSGVIFLLCYFFTQRQMGGGDVKLSFILGLYLTGQRIMGAVFYGAILSLLFSVIQLIRKKVTLKDGIPFVPFLYLGTLITLLLT